MKLRHDFAGHYNRPDIFQLNVNRAAPQIYTVHTTLEKLPPVKTPALSVGATENTPSAERKRKALPRARAGHRKRAQRKRDDK